MEKANPPPTHNYHVLPAALHARAIHELYEMWLNSAFVDSRLESIERFLNNFANQANTNDLDSDDESVDTPLVSPFPHSDNDLDDGEVLNELSEYDNAGTLRCKGIINSFDGDDLAFQCMIDMALPPRDQRYQYLRVQVFNFGGLTDLMAERLSDRMLMEHRMLRDRVCLLAELGGGYLMFEVVWYGYCKNHKKTVKTRQTRTREWKECIRAGSLIAKRSRLEFKRSSPGAPSAGPSTPSRVLKLQAIAWKDKCTQGNNGDAYASKTTCSILDIITQAWMIGLANYLERESEVSSKRKCNSMKCDKKNNQPLPMAGKGFIYKCL
ncbi:hypothetical protein Tco_0568492 [Tanacetum coccineum]